MSHTQHLTGNTLLTKKNILPFSLTQRTWEPGLGERRNKNSFSSFVENINPNYVTGFVDGEGCFSVYVSENVKPKNGWKINLVFSIYIDKRDIYILEKIDNFFNSVGNIQTNPVGSITYSVTSIKDLSNIIIPHF